MLLRERGGIDVLIAGGIGLDRGFSAAAIVDDIYMTCT
jgi:hypothetical protein